MIDLYTCIVGLRSALSMCLQHNLDAVLVFSQQTRNICMTFAQCWTNVEDVVPTLYKCYTNILCLLGCYIDFENVVPRSFLYPTPRPLVSFLSASELSASTSFACNHLEFYVNPCAAGTVYIRFFSSKLLTK